MSLNSIVVGTDFSEPSRVALDWAVDLARALGGARLVVVHVYDLPLAGIPDGSLMVDASTASRMSDIAQAGLDAEVARVCDGGAAVEGLLRQGNPSDVLPSVALAENAGLIVVGSHGRRGLARALLGSVAESVLRASSTPVTIIPVHAS